jgi:mono/diheme cytochrome c family protein
MMKRRIGWLLAGTLLVAGACSSEPDGGKGAAATAKAGAAPTKTATPEMLEKGRALYKANCVACHGETGKGDGPGAGVLKPPPRDHTDRAYMSTMSNEEIGRVIQMGGAIKGRPLMPSHPQIRDADLEALVAYVRSLSEPK